MDDLHEYLSVHKDKISLAKNDISPYVSPVLDAFVLARVTKDLGITGKVIPKVINGKQYVVFSGYPGLRNIFTTPIYKANSSKIINMAIGRLGVLKAIAKGTYITIFLTIPLTTIESILRDPGNLYALFGHVAADVIKIAIPSLAMAIVGIGATGSATFVSLPMGAVILIGVFGGLALNHIDNRYKLTEKLIVTLEDLEGKIKSAAGNSAQTVGEGVWNTLRSGGLGMGGFVRTY